MENAKHHHLLLKVPSLVRDITSLMEWDIESSLYLSVFVHVSRRFE
jgi:hypothetical protein